MKKIIHIDMDSFFPSVEILEMPHLKYKPVAVGGRPDTRGVIASCNYIARKYGIRSAMSSYKALTRCPALIIISPNMQKYIAYSQKIREIFFKYTDKIEFISLDEAYLDVTDVKLYNNSATLIACAIKKEILKNTKLTASAGVAYNKFLAKIASDWNKPDGLMVITPKIADKFISQLPVKKIPGVGRAMQRKIHNMGINICKDLQLLSKYELVRHFKSYGLKLYNFARGIDDREVISDRVKKSLSVENTFPVDLHNLEDCVTQIESLFERLTKRLQKNNDLRIIKLFIKLKDNSFKQVTYESIEHKTPSVENFNLLLEKCHRKLSNPIRLIGIGVRFHETIQETEIQLDLL